MGMDDKKPKTVTLDPDDWEEFRAVGHQMIDDMIAFLQNLHARPVWQPIHPDVEKGFKKSLPMKPKNIQDVYKEFLYQVLPYPTGNIHPRFWGWINGAGCPVSMYADLLASGMNACTVGLPDSSSLVELQVIDWMKEMLDYPMNSSGILVSGGSAANLVGLTVARNAVSEAAEKGVGGIPKKLVLYGSTETHFTVQRAVEVLGLGRDSIRKIPVNDKLQMDVQKLREEIEKDRKAGHLPFCVIATAGATQTGSVDDLDALADVAEAYGLWYHVDGAIGSVGYLSPRLHSVLKGMNRADSLAFDLHKWMQIPYEAGCVLIRSKETHLKTFNSASSFLKSEALKRLALFTETSIQVSRNFKALKIWMSLKTHGIDKFRMIIEQCLDQTAHLVNLINDHPDLELMAPVTLHIVCFRFVAPGLSGEQLDALNQQILDRLRNEGIAIVSNMNVKGRLTMRACVNNHRSKFEDFDLLVREAARIGHDLLAAETEKKAA